MQENIYFGEKKLGFGLMRLPLLDPNNDKSIDKSQVNQMVDLFIERGFTYFDTAYMYHGFQSENIVKECLVSRHPRNSFTLATKLHHDYVKTPEDCWKVFNEQLEKTGVEFFDYYLLHDIRDMFLPSLTENKVFDFLKEIKEKGLARHIGFSFHDGPAVLERVLKEHPEMEFVQLQFNFLDYENEFVQARRNYEVAASFGKPIIVMEPVKGGTLNNIPEGAKRILKQATPEASIASWAIRFAASFDSVKMVLSGMSNLEQLDDNTSYMQDFTPLSDAEKDILLSAKSCIEESVSIPCTACSYCTEGCPVGIPIPKYFQIFNLEKLENPDLTDRWTSQVNYYTVLNKTFPAAVDCVECRQCESICPQQLPIADLMKDVSARFDKKA